MPAPAAFRSDRFVRRATAAGVAAALVALALLSPTPPTADHVLLGAPAQAADTWLVGKAPAAGHPVRVAGN